MSRLRPFRKIAPLLAVAALSGCAVLNIGNPFWPEGRYLLTANPNMITVSYEFSRQANQVNITATEPVFTLAGYLNDAAPGIKLTEYSAEYADMSGHSISSLFIAKTQLGVGAYLPPKDAKTSPTVTLALPAYNQQVRLFGLSQVFQRDTKGGIIDLAKDFSHVVSCKIKLYGTDDNFNTIEIPFELPIRFESSITQ